MAHCGVSHVITHTNSRPRAVAILLNKQQQIFTVHFLSRFRKLSICLYQIKVIRPERQMRPHAAKCEVVHNVQKYKQSPKFYPELSLRLTKLHYQCFPHALCRKRVRISEICEKHRRS